MFVFLFKHLTCFFFLIIVDDIKLLFFQGKCSIQDQLPTIVKLTGFIMNILGTNGETKIIPEAADKIIDYYLNNQVNIIPSSLKITKLSHNEARRYIKNINERVKEQKTCDAPDNVKKVSLIIYF